ncbi:MAG: leucine-rich repeat domain-containing protein [Prevotella sp.]|nr:leucine-rich repeat domain-containing protein [Prevotella sp.]
MRKTYTLIVMLAMMFVGANSVSAQTSYTDDQGVVYSIGETATVTGYTGTATEITIPATIQEVAVTQIGESAFEGNTTITKVGFDANGSYTIGKNAFKGCTAFSNIPTGNSTITAIGDGAFEGCTSLRTTTTNTNTFSCVNVVTVGKRAFRGCTNLSGLYLDAATSIGDSAFMGSTVFSIRNDNIETIGIAAFRGCSSLKTIGSTTAVVSLPKVLDVSNYAFYGNFNMTTVQLPIATRIGNRAFYNSSSKANALTTITGGENLTSIGDSAFYGCNVLKTIGDTEGLVYLPKVAQIRPYTFLNCKAIEAVKMNQEGNYYCDFYNAAFYNCPALTKVSTKNVRTMGQLAFYKCSSLVGIDNNDNPTQVRLLYTTQIQHNAFNGCSSITTLNIGSNKQTSFSSFGNNALKGCSSLAAIYLYALNAPTLGTDAFSGLKSDAAFVLNPTNSYTKASNYANNDSWKVWFDGTNSSYKLVAYINKSNQYGTVSCDVPLHFIYTSTPAIYKVTATNDASAQLEEISSKKLPANTGAVMEKDLTFAGVQVQVLFDSSESADDFTDNLLVANVTENTNFVGNEGNTWNLILSNGKFVKATDGTLAAGLAYLPRTFEGGEAKELSLTFDDLTSIRTIDNVENTVDNGAWYTIDGTRLQGEPTTKGIYVRGGKKVVVK